MTTTETNSTIEILDEITALAAELEALADAKTIAELDYDEEAISLESDMDALEATISERVRDALALSASKEAILATKIPSYFVP